MPEKCPKCGAEVTQWDVYKSVSQWTCQECGLEEIEHLRNQLKAMDRELLEARTAPREVPDGMIYSQVSLVGEVERLKGEATEAKMKYRREGLEEAAKLCNEESGSTGDIGRMVLITQARRIRRLITEDKK